jgi:hypothetical protein
MDVSLTNEERVDRAARAREWLDQPLTKEVLATVRQAALDGFLATRFDDKELLVYYRLYAKLCAEIEQSVLNIINDGAMAADEIRMARERDKLERAHPEYRRFR